MSNNWSTVKLGEVLRHRKEFVVIDDLKNYRRPRVQLHAQGIVIRDEVPGALIKTKQQQVCNAGEFLVAEIDAKVGGFGIVPVSLDGSIVSSHYFLFTIDDAKLNRNFLDYFIRTPMFREQVEAQGSTNYAAIRPSHVFNYEIPLPTLAEQRRIVARIEELFVKIEEARGLRSQIKDETGVLFAKALARAFEPYTASMRSIGDVFSVTTGGTPPRGNPAFWGGDVKWVSSGEVNFRTIDDTAEKITRDGVENSSAKVNPPGTVLLAMIGQGKTRGQCAILGCYAANNQNVAAIHVYKTPHKPEYVYWWLYSQYQQSRSVETGTAQPALSGERVKRIPIPIAPIDEQCRIVSELNDLQNKINVLKTLQRDASAEIAALIPSIFDKAFRGEL